MVNDYINPKTRVLVDTNIYSEIKNSHLTDESKKALELINKTDKTIYLTDLSFIELVEEYNNLEDYEKFRKTTKFYKLEIFGHNLELIEDGLRIFKSHDLDFTTFIALRSRLIKKKRKIMTYYFREIVITYTVLFNLIIADSFPTLFSINNIKNIIKKLNEESALNDLNDLLNFIKEKEENIKENSLHEICLGFMGAYNPQFAIKMKEMEIDKKLSEMTLKFVKMRKKEDKYKKYQNYNNIEFLIMLLKKEIAQNCLENKVLNDAISFSVIYSGILQGKFHINNIVDIYNLSISCNDENYFIYISHDTSWADFIKAEIKLHPETRKRFEVLLNLYNKNQR